MVLKGETIGSGASGVCCGNAVELGVMQSAAGWYVGTRCVVCSMPYSRETGYCATQAGARSALSALTVTDWRSSSRRRSE